MEKMNYVEYYKYKKKKGSYVYLNYEKEFVFWY